MEKIILLKPEKLDDQGFCIDLAEFLKIDNDGFLWRGFMTGKSDKSTMTWYLMDDRHVNKWSETL